MKRILLACVFTAFLAACQDTQLPTSSPDVAESPDFKKGGKKNSKGGKKNIHAQINAAIKEICTKPRSVCNDPKSEMFDAVGEGDFAAAQTPALTLANLALQRLADDPGLASEVEAFIALLQEFAQLSVPEVSLADALASPGITVTERTGIGLATPETPVVVTSDPGLGGGLGFAVAVFDDGDVNEPLWVFVNSPQDLREQDCHPFALVGEQIDGCSLMDVFPPLAPEEEFASDVIIAVCLDFGSPLAAAARLYRSDGPGGTFAEELDPAASPTQLIEDCDDPQYSSAGGSWLGNFASSSWRKLGLPLASALLPKPLEANTLLAGISGSLGGRTRKFSNFGWAVPLPAGPDLIIQGIEVSPEEPTSDDDLSFTVTVENIGDGPAGPSELLFEIGGEIEGEGAAYIDFFITVFAEVGPLAPGASEAIEISEYGDYECEGPCPISLAAGDYIARATANVGEEPVDETEEENNTLDVEFTVLDVEFTVVALPDLIIQSIVLDPSTPTDQDESIIATVVVKNIGVAPADPFDVTVVLQGPGLGGPPLVYTVPIGDGLGPAGDEGDQETIQVDLLEQCEGTPLPPALGFQVIQRTGRTKSRSLPTTTTGSALHRSA